MGSTALLEKITTDRHQRCTDPNNHSRPGEKYYFRSAPVSGRAAYPIRPPFRALLKAGLRQVSVPISFEDLRDEAIDGTYSHGATAMTMSPDAAVGFTKPLEQRK
ncbi:hypothetical protein F4802DRAFT_31604 [Xylaria palmicola]|nr:hypothetical protein F4802DRAFT_31604 [Xylaria palmicola]